MRHRQDESPLSKPTLELTPTSSTSLRTVRISKYSVVVELGKGGMATVYLGVYRGRGGFQKLQVIKRLRPSLAEDPDFLQMFLDEARLAARINHPNVVQTNEIGSEGDVHFIAMEYLEGQTLEAITRASRKRGDESLPLGIHLRIISQVLEGLHHAHELCDFGGTPLEVVHRDVSPQNVMVTYDGHVKVLDFGIAKAADSAQTRAGILKGKCAYMSPEQFGHARLDRRSDIFSVGILLWQALAGRRMWEGRTETEIFKCLAQGEIPTVSSVKSDVPEALEKLCMRALAPTVDARIATAAELQNGIDDYLAENSVRVGAGQIGAFVTGLFAERRAATRQLVESHLKAESVEMRSEAPTEVGPAPSVSHAEAVAIDTTRTELRRERSRFVTLGAGLLFVGVSAGLGWRTSREVEPMTTLGTASVMTAASVPVPLATAPPPPSASAEAPVGPASSGSATTARTQVTASPVTKLTPPTRPWTSPPPHAHAAKAPPTASNVATASASTSAPSPTHTPPPATTPTRPNLGY